jgi:hypothetical protein
VTKLGYDDKGAERQAAGENTTVKKWMVVSLVVEFQKPVIPGHPIRDLLPLHSSRIIEILVNVYNFCTVLYYCF